MVNQASQNAITTQFFGTLPPPGFSFVKIGEIVFELVRLLPVAGRRKNLVGREFCVHGALSRDCTAGDGSSAATRSTHVPVNDGAAVPRPAAVAVVRPVQVVADGVSDVDILQAE